MIALFRFATIAALLALIAGLSAIVTMQFAVHRTIVHVPDVEGMPVDAAVRRAATLGLDLSVTQRFFSTALPAGQILLQTPSAGSEVRRGWDLAVAESLGPRHISIPDVRGKSEHDAIFLIRERGLELGAIAHLPDDRVPIGTVLAQDPDESARGAAQPSVSLLVASPEPSAAQAWVMPDERGHGFDEASATLAAAGLHAERAAGAPAGAQITINAAAQPGLVVAQTPPAGARVDASTPVLLYAAADAGASH